MTLQNQGEAIPQTVSVGNASFESIRRENCFFSNRYQNQSELFEGLEIWKDETYRKLQGTYPVIFLSFASVKANSYENAKK